MIHRHHWTAWKVFDRQLFEDADFGGRWWEVWQSRQCTHCGRTRIRKERA